MITIFIHGTLLFPNLIFMLPPIRHFFYCPPGLTKAKKLSIKYQMAKIARTLSAEDKKRFNLNNFYLFGWSGCLNATARKNAAHELYCALQKICKKNKQNKIRLITHSHGGNVALYLRLIAQEESKANCKLNNINSSSVNINTKYAHDNTYFTIEELILLACPVQERTAEFISDPFFRKVYSFHSDYDLIQVIDPQAIHDILDHYKSFYSASLGPLFSERHFNHSSNLKQVQIKINNYSLSHIDFLFLKFIKLLPLALDMLEDNYFLKQLQKNGADIILNLQD